MNKTAKKIALVGVDGSGKSSIMRRFIELAPVSADQILGLTCPQFHDTPDTPLSDLSAALDCFSQTSDKFGSFEMKAAALFLQMTLYGPISAFMENTFNPQILITERHPLVDALAYSPFYSMMVKEAPDLSKMEDTFEHEINRVYNQGYKKILQWLSLQNQRLGKNHTIDQLSIALRDLFTQPMEHVLAELKGWYQADFPDVVVLLDPSIDTIIERIQERSGALGKELHETDESLKHLKTSYKVVLEKLPQISPQTKTYTINTGGSEVDSTLEQILELIVP